MAIVRNLVGELQRIAQKNNTGKNDIQKIIRATSITADLIVGSIITTRNWDVNSVNLIDDNYITMCKQIIFFKIGNTIVGAHGFVTDIVGNANIFGTVYGAGAGNDTSLNKGFINKDTVGFNVFFVSSSNIASGFQFTNGAINATHPITIKTELGSYLTLNAANWATKLELNNVAADTSLNTILSTSGKITSGVHKGNLASGVQTTLGNADTIFGTYFGGNAILNSAYIADAAISASKVNMDKLILDGLTWNTNTPSAGYISWSAGASGIHISLNGVTKTIPVGSTTDKYVYWDVGNAYFSTTNTKPVESNTRFFIATNTSGVPAKMYGAQLGPKYIVSAFIDELAVNDAHIANCNIGKLTAGTLTADLVLGAKIQTNVAGYARMVLEAAGLTSYHMDGGTEKKHGCVMEAGNASAGYELYYNNVNVGGLSSTGTTNITLDAIGSIIIEAGTYAYTYLRGNIIVDPDDTNFDMTNGRATMVIASTTPPSNGNFLWLDLN